jgi:hypothetical protein
VTRPTPPRTRRATSGVDAVAAVRRVLGLAHREGDAHALSEMLDRHRVLHHVFRGTSGMSLHLAHGPLDFDALALVNISDAEAAILELSLSRNTSGIRVLVARDVAGIEVGLCELFSTASHITRRSSALAAPPPIIGFALALLDGDAMSLASFLCTDVVLAADASCLGIPTVKGAAAVARQLPSLVQAPPCVLCFSDWNEPYLTLPDSLLTLQLGVRDGVFDRLTLHQIDAREITPATERRAHP